MNDRPPPSVVVGDAAYSSEDYRRLVDRYERLVASLGDAPRSSSTPSVWRVELESGGRAECEADGTFVLVRRYLPPTEVGEGSPSGGGHCLRVWRMPEELVPGLACADRMTSSPEGVVVPEGWQPERGWYDPDARDLRRLRHACCRCLGRIRARDAA